jgi:hypothetical protein
VTVVAAAVVVAVEVIAEVRITTFGRYFIGLPSSVKVFSLGRLFESQRRP